MPGRRLLVALAAALLLLGAAPAAHARDGEVTSFDGTKIKLTFIPAAEGKKAPTLLLGHGWSQTRSRDTSNGGESLFGSAGAGTLHDAGYNILTWDARGFGESGGTVQVDWEQAEGRDVQALIDFLAQQPEAQLDKAGDPRVGMSGPSYGGGIQLVTAAIDSRVDAIVPVIAWNSLITSLFKDGAVKAGWGTLLFALGHEGGLLPGLPAGETGTLDPHITSSYLSGLTTGSISDEDRAWYVARGTDHLLSRIKVPTLLIEGTADTLFTLDESIRNHAALSRNGIPLKMIWFCGGHGVCLTNSGPSGFTDKATIAWFDRYLKGDTSVDTGPAFEWIADDGAVRSAAGFPLDVKERVETTGSGTLAINPDAATSGLQIAASPGVNALQVPLKSPSFGSQILGAPRVSLTYSGTAASANTIVYGQILDRKRGLVVGNQAAPIPLVLDGQEHTLTLPLEAIASSVGEKASYVLEIVPYTSVYGPQKHVGAVTFSRIEASLPVVEGFNVEARRGAAANASCRGRLSASVSARSAPLGLHFVRSTRAVRTPRGRSMLVRVCSDRRLRGVRLTLRQHRRVVGRSRVRTLLGSQSVRLSLKRKLKRGSYTLQASGLKSDGRRGRAAIRLRFR